MRSLGLFEADLQSLFSEALSAEHESVLSDEALGLSCDSAGT